MSDTRDPIDFDQRIGLGPESTWTDDWPTYGYDGELREFFWEDEPRGEFAATGYTKAQWLALGDEMIRRWTAWRARIASLPDGPLEARKSDTSDPAPR